MWRLGRSPPVPTTVGCPCCGARRIVRLLIVAAHHYAVLRVAEVNREGSRRISSGPPVEAKLPDNLECRRCKPEEARVLRERRACRPSPGCTGPSRKQTPTNYLRQKRPHLGQPCRSQRQPPSRVPESRPRYKNVRGQGRQPELLSSDLRPCRKPASENRRHPRTHPSPSSVSPESNARSRRWSYTGGTGLLAQPT